MYKEARWESALIPSPLLPLGRKSDYTKSRRGKGIPKAVETCVTPTRQNGGTARAPAATAGEGEALQGTGRQSALRVLQQP